MVPQPSPRRSYSLRPIMVAVLGGVLLAAPAFAVQYTVTTTDDENDGACTPADCSLREAIVAANATAEADEVILPAGTYALTLTGDDDAASSGDLDVTADLTLSGAGADAAVIDGIGGDRVFEILAGVVDISNVTIRNGLAGFPGGGGINNLGTLTLTDCILSNNSTTGSGGGLFGARGGAILNQGGALTVTACTLTGNSGGEGGAGGALVVAGGVATLADCTLSENVATPFGSFPGGVRGGGGGALVADGSAVVALTNCTLSGNSAAAGGALAATDSVVTLTNCTLSGNSATIGGAIYSVESEPATEIRLVNTIVANSTSGGNCSSAVIDDGHNLQYPGADCGATIASLDPQLDPAGLQDNGGPTQTIALLENSFAIDAGDSAVCAGPPVNGLDQRG